MSSSHTSQGKKCCTPCFVDEERDVPPPLCTCFSSPPGHTQTQTKANTSIWNIDYRASDEGNCEPLNHITQAFVKTKLSGEECNTEPEIRDYLQGFGRLSLWEARLELLASKSGTQVSGRSGGSMPQADPSYRLSSQTQVAGSAGCQVLTETLFSGEFALEMYHKQLKVCFVCPSHSVQPEF